MLRPLLHFFLIGGLLFSAKSIYDRRVVEGPELTVVVSAESTPPEVETAIREAILLNEAKRYGWDRHDPIVFSHLVRNMRFIEPESTDDDAELYKRALDMGMHEHDPIVRARLLYRAEAALAFVPEGRMPDRDALEAHRQEHRDRFEREGRIRFLQVFLSRSKRGDSLPSDARDMRAQLDELGDALPVGLGDPLPGLRPELFVTASKLRTGFGAELADAVDEAVVGAWRGPVASVYGLHFIKVLDEEPARVPPLAAIRAEVRADLLAEIQTELRKERMDALVDAYTVRVERVP